MEKMPEWNRTKLTDINDWVTQADYGKRIGKSRSFVQLLVRSNQVKWVKKGPQFLIYVGDMVIHGDDLNRADRVNAGVERILSQRVRDIEQRLEPLEKCHRKHLEPGVIPAGGRY